MAIVYWTGGADDGDWTNVTNWSTGSVPVTSDDVTIDRTNNNISLNLNQSAVTLASLNIGAGFSGTLGNVPDSPSNEYLQVGATLLIIGEGLGNGSQRLNIDLGAVVSTVNILQASSTGTDFPKAPVRIKGNNSSNEIQINGENSNIAFLDDPDNTGALGSITIINSSNVEIGSGATYTSLTVLAGTVNSLETSGTVKIESGTLTLEGTGAIASVTQTGGEVIWNSTGTITTYTGRGGILTTTDSTLARTITTLTKSSGFTFNRNENITVTTDAFDAAFSNFTITIT